jgi:hypothetical protein
VRNAGDSKEDRWRCFSIRETTEVISKGVPVVGTMA